MHTDELVPWPVRTFMSHVNNLNPIDPMQKLSMIVQPPFQPPSASSSKQISDWNNFKQTILNIIKNSTDLAITLQTIQQLGLGIAHAFSTLIINSFKKLVLSQTSPAFDHYDFLLPRDLSSTCRMSACRFCCPNGDILCRVGDMLRHVAGHVADTRKVMSAGCPKRHDIWRHVEGFPTCR